MKLDWNKMIRGIIDIAESAAAKTKGRGDDMAIALLKAALEKFAPSYASEGPGEETAYASLPAEMRVDLDGLMANCELTSGD